MGIRAPSLYKHLTALFESGDALHAAVADPGRRTPVVALLAAYRRNGLTHPKLYRLVTGATFPRSELTAGLEDWAGEPFFLAVGEPYVAQALWSPTA